MRPGGGKRREREMRLGGGSGEKAGCGSETESGESDRRLLREKGKEILTARLEKKYRQELSGRKKTYQEWVRQQEKIWTFRGHREEGEEPTGPRTLTLPDSPIQWLELEQVWIFCARDGRLSDIALKRIARYFAKFTDVLLAYGDEDVEDARSGERRSPWWKPDWSPDTFCAYFYWGSVVILRRDWRESAEERKLREEREARPWYPHWKAESEKAVERRLWTREEIRGRLIADDAALIRPEDFYSFVMELVHKAGGFQRGGQRIGRIPSILFHGREEALQESYERISMKDYEPERAETQKGQENPLVSIIIPSRDHPQLLGQCLTAIRQTVTETAYEVILVDNGSSQENRHEIEALLRAFPMRSTYLYQPMDFHFSRMCNLGAGKAAGEYLLFLNDDVEVCEKGWLEKMLAHAARRYTGAVGLKLYYPKSRRIQHAGITNLPMGPVHKLQFLSDEESFDHGRNRFDWNVMAVTGACLMCRRELFWNLRGFSEELQVAFNDVEFCLRLWLEGYANVVVNESHAFHHESLSRGADESVEKQERLQRELERLYRGSPGLRGYDPYYPRELNRDCLDTRIRPAYLTAGNQRQFLFPRLCGLEDGRLKWMPGEELRKWKDRGLEKLWGADQDGDGPAEEETAWMPGESAWMPGETRAFRTGSLKALYGGTLRRDDCLLFRMERSDFAQIQGYGVVLGDNNACYDRYLLLCPISEPGEEDLGTRAISGRVYVQPLWGQYRPDLEENMPDQKNVALCGFCLGLPRADNSLPLWDYRLGMIARNRITGLMLLNWSNRIWHRRGNRTDPDN